MPNKTTDPDNKGAVESQAPGQCDNMSIDGQLPHPQTGDFDGTDTDFPEPGPREEHSGEDRPSRGNHAQ
jgi:hypothetical protein